MYGFSPLNPHPQFSIHGSTLTYNNLSTAAAWNVLQPFSVSNRVGMFVFQDETGKVFYVRVSEGTCEAAATHRKRPSAESQTSMFSSREWFCDDVSCVVADSCEPQLTRVLFYYAQTRTRENKTTARRPFPAVGARRCVVGSHLTRAWRSDPITTAVCCFRPRTAPWSQFFSLPVTGVHPRAGVWCRPSRLGDHCAPDGHAQGIMAKPKIPCSVRHGGLRDRAASSFDSL